MEEIGRKERARSMSRQILELSEDADLVERLKKLVRDKKLDSAWMRVIGTVKNAVFVKADGGDTFVPGVLHLVHGDVVATSTTGTLQLQASVTVTKDGKSTICGMLKSARIVSVFVHVDSPSFADAKTVSAAKHGSLPSAEGDSAGWSRVKGGSDTRNENEAPRAESILETEDEATLLERLTRRSRTAAPAQEELSIDDQDDQEDDSDESVDAAPESGNLWGSVAKTSDEVRRSGRPTAAPAPVEETSDEEDTLPDTGDSNPWAMVAETSDSVKQSTKRKSSKSSGKTSASFASDEPKSRSDKLKAFAESVEDFMDVDELNRGDILEHPILGECRVLRVINDDSAQVQINRGASRKLMLKIFNIIRSGDGRYKLEKKG